MPLPVMSVPEFFVNLPSSNKRLKLRPFLVKEEKILMMALQSESDEEIQNAIVQILQNCISDETVDVEAMPSIDVEWVFLQLRMKSKGEVAEFAFRCKSSVSSTVDGVDIVCNHRNELSVNLNDVEVINKEFSTTVKLSETVGVEMKAPSLALRKDLAGFVDGDDPYLIVSKLISTIYDQETVHDVSKYSDEEIIAWLDGLTTDQFKELFDYFKKLPKLSLTIPYVCGKCGYREELKIEGLSNFFV